MNEGGLSEKVWLPQPPDSRRSSVHPNAKLTPDRASRARRAERRRSTGRPRRERDGDRAADRLPLVAPLAGRRT